MDDQSNEAARRWRAIVENEFARMRRIRAANLASRTFTKENFERLETRDAVWLFFRKGNFGRLDDLTAEIARRTSDPGALLEVAKIIVDWWCDRNPASLPPQEELEEARRKAFAALDATEREDTPIEVGDGDSWREFKHDGNWLTTGYIEDRFGFAGHVLSRDAEALQNRQDNPNPTGRGHVYRLRDVLNIAERRA